MQHKIFAVKKSRILIPAALITILVLVSFLPSLRNDFVNWDDNLYLAHNQAIRSISWGNLKNISTSFFLTHYQPATIFSYALEYHFFKLNPFPYHLTNLTLHLLNCLLVFWMVYLFAGNLPIAFLVALLFGVHPLQVESVAWVSQRKTLLYAFFYLSALVGYLYYLRRGLKVKYYFFCLSLFTLALLSKSLALTLPLVLLLLDYASRRKFNRRLLIEKIPFFTLSLLGGLVALRGGYLATVFYEEHSYGLLTRLIGASSDIIFYLYKLCWPGKLSAIYPALLIQEDPLYLWSLSGMIILFTAMVISGRRFRKVILGGGFFLLTIFPAIRFLPLEEALVADHYVYLPAIGIFYLFAQGVFWLFHKKTKYRFPIKGVLVSALTTIIIALSILTWQRCRVWQDSLSLWNNVLQNYPSIAKAYNNRGEFFLGRKEFALALADFNTAVQMKSRSSHDPTYKYYYLNLGNALRAQGKIEEAMGIFRGLIREAEEYFMSLPLQGATDKNRVLAAHRKNIEAGAYFNLGNIQDGRGDQSQALALYLKAIELSPQLVYAHESLGALYAGQGKMNEAAQEFKRAIEIDKSYLPAYIRLAKVYRELGQEEELIRLYKEAAGSNLDFFEAYNYLGNLYADAQNEKKAIRLFRKAVEINPASAAACLGLGNAYLTAGRNKEAIIWLQKALTLNPQASVVHNNLALAYYYAKKFDLAVKHARQAVESGYPVSPKLLNLLQPYSK